MDAVRKLKLQIVRSDFYLFRNVRLDPGYIVFILPKLYIIYDAILFKLVRDVPLDELVASPGALATLVEKVDAVGVFVVLAEEIGWLQVGNIALSCLLAL